MQALHISPYKKKYVRRIYSARLNVILSLSVLGLEPSIFFSFSFEYEMPFGISHGSTDTRKSYALYDDCLM